MPYGLFDDRDLTALTRALIPWTATLILPDEAQERAFLARRTMRGYPLRDLRHWGPRDVAADINVARAARSIYIARALGRAARALGRALRGAFGPRLPQPAIVGAPR